MKFLFDFLPILLFFAAFKLYDIYVATAVAMATTVLQVAWQWLQHRKVEPMPLVTLVLIVVLGGATLILQDETFIKWKPTAVNWLFGAVFLGSRFIGKKTIVEYLLGANLALPKPVWFRLNASWVIFFIVIGIVNLYIAFNFDTETWVNFKLFGMMGLTLLFVVGQAFYLAHHLKTDNLATKE